jgi:hypothetical protein
VKAVLAKVEQAATNDLAKKQVTAAQGTVAKLEARIAHGLEVRSKQQALIGQAALPLKAHAWLNGSEIAPAELKGKVVLLDFFFAPTSESHEEPWTATLRQVAEWQKKYAGRGLVVIGMTRYNNYRWDDAAQKPVRVTKGQLPVTAAEEQYMLRHVTPASGSHRPGRKGPPCSRRHERRLRARNR